MSIAINWLILKTFLYNLTWSYSKHISTGNFSSYRLMVSNLWPFEVGWHGVIMICPLSRQLWGQYSMAGALNMSIAINWWIPKTFLSNLTWSYSKYISTGNFSSYGLTVFKLWPFENGWHGVIMICPSGGQPSAFQRLAQNENEF
jgi:hypothetical protein